MNNFIFKIIANLLSNIGSKTGLTYNEINIIVYYFIIPFSWLLLLDIIFDFYYFKFSFAIFCIGFIVGCRNFKSYSNWLFEKSVTFLNYFNRFGSNYIVSSVWICVTIPILIYTVLLILIFK